MCAATFTSDTYNAIILSHERHVEHVVPEDFTIDVQHIFEEFSIFGKTT